MCALARIKLMQNDKIIIFHKPFLHAACIVNKRWYKIQIQYSAMSCNAMQYQKCGGNMRIITEFIYYENSGKFCFTKKIFAAKMLTKIEYNLL